MANKRTCRGAFFQNIGPILPQMRGRPPNDADASLTCPLAPFLNQARGMPCQGRVSSIKQLQVQGIQKPAIHGSIPRFAILHLHIWIFVL